MSSNFVASVEGLRVSASPVRRFLDGGGFPDFTGAAFPLLALGSEVSREVLDDVATELNKQARDNLGFGEDEFEEFGLAVIIPDDWRYGDRDPQQAIEWFMEHSPKTETVSHDQPKWYIPGFVGVAEVDWKNRGLVFVHYEPSKDHLLVEAMVLDPSKEAGEALISLRQGGDDFGHLKEWHGKASSVV